MSVLTASTQLGGHGSGPVDVVHVGLKPIGRQVLTFRIDRARYRVAEAVDIDPSPAGPSLDDVLNGSTTGGRVRVGGTVDETEAARPGAIAIHCAGSSLERIAPTLTWSPEAEYRLDSTCEELSDPWCTQGELAETLDQAACPGLRTVDELPASPLAM